jgi:hypothetical protein
MAVGSSTVARLSSRRMERRRAVDQRGRWLAALIVGLSAARELRGAPLIATVAIGLLLLMANLLARPHVLTLPLAAAWGAGLINRIVTALDREPGRRCLYADATAVVHVRDTALGRKGLGRNDRAREKEQRKLGPKAR